ncbi:hypothetical protein LTT61_06855 [Nocardia asteroides]|nr:hypothetical protein [Nocardia asteroides]UGT63043.1 hypothetical protein LTT61_06855 [Nocardia asteroides]
MVATVSTAVACRSAVSRSSSAGGLQADEVAEDGGADQAVAVGEREQFGAEFGALGGEAGAGEALHVSAVQGVREQGGVAELAGQPLGFPCRVRSARGGIAAAGLHRDGGEQAAAEGGRRGERGEVAFGGADEGPRPGRVVRAGPERGDVVAADHPGGELGVAELLGGGHGVGAVPLGGFEAVAAGEGEVAQQADRGGEAGAVGDGTRVGGRGLGPDAGRATGRVEVLGLVQHLPFQPGEPRAGVDAEPVAQDGAGAAHGAERVGLPAGAIQGERQEPPALLAPRVLQDVRIEFGRGGAGVAECDPRFGQAFDRVQPEFGEAGARGDGPRRLPGLGVGGAPPPAERLGEGGGDVGGRCVAERVDGGGEAPGIDGGIR